MKEQMKLFNGTAVKMQLISNGLCYDDYEEIW